MVMGVAIINASWRNSHPQMTRRFIPAHKENKHEARCTKKFAQAQETKEAPCYEENEELKKLVELLQKKVELLEQSTKTSSVETKVIK